MFDPKQMEKAMKQMGIQTEQIEATEVIIKGPAKSMVIRSPSVVRMDVKGQTMFQITGNVSEAPYSEEDIRLVSEKAEVSMEKAAELLERTNGDIAEAIMLAKSDVAEG
jgi:nascent polypeptide-associated complex subunit alpha